MQSIPLESSKLNLIACAKPFFILLSTYFLSFYRKVSVFEGDKSVAMDISKSPSLLKDALNSFPLFDLVVEL